MQRLLLALALSPLLAACPPQRSDLDPSNPNRLEDAEELPPPSNEGAKAGAPAQGNVAQGPNVAQQGNARVIFDPNTVKVTRKK